MEVEEVSSTGPRRLLLNSLKDGNRYYYYYKQDHSHQRIEDEDKDDSTSAASSKDSLITMPPTTASLKTHTGHGHKKAADVAGENAVTEGRRSRHHSGNRNRHAHHHHHRSRHHDLSPGITTPTPVQQSSEVSLTLKAAAKMMLTTFSPFPGKMTLATIVSRTLSTPISSSAI